MSSYSTQHLKNEKRLKIALLLTICFIVIELIGGLASNSLSLLSDAAHLFTDAAALMISLVAMRISRKAADRKRTFGYYRFEILAAVINATFLFLVAFYIFIQGYRRFFIETQVHSTSMLVIATLGLLMNIVNLALLYEGSQESLNVKSAYLDAKADMLSSIGVIVAALLIKLTHWEFLDSLVAILIALWILPRSWLLLKESLNILLEGVPEGINLQDIEETLTRLPGVLEIHDLHVWALTNGKISLTAHFMVEPSLIDEQPLLKLANKQLVEKFNITHSTIQIERTRCEYSTHVH